MSDEGQLVGLIINFFSNLFFWILKEKYQNKGPLDEVNITYLGKEVFEIELCSNKNKDKSHYNLGIVL